MSETLHRLLEQESTGLLQRSVPLHAYSSVAARSVVCSRRMEPKICFLQIDGCRISPTHLRHSDGDGFVAGVEASSQNEEEMVLDRLTSCVSIVPGSSFESSGVCTRSFVICI